MKFIYHPKIDSLRKKFDKVKLFLIILSIIFTIVLNMLVLKHKGFPNRYSELLLNDYGSVLNWNILRQFEPGGPMCFDNIDGCVFGKEFKKKIYLIGDSTAATLSYDLKDKLKMNSYQLITFVIGGCIYFPGFDSILKQTNKVSTKCNQKYFDKVKKVLNEDENQIIIFKGLFHLYSTEQHFIKDGAAKFEWSNKFQSNSVYETIEESFAKEVVELSKKHKIILILPMPEPGYNVALILQKLKNEKNLLVAKQKLNDDQYKIKYDSFLKKNKKFIDFLNSINGKNINHLDVSLNFCDKQKNVCKVFDDKKVYFSDNSHPSLTGAELINNSIINKIKEIDN